MLKKVESLGRGDCFIYNWHGDTHLEVRCKLFYDKSDNKGFNGPVGSTSTYTPVVELTCKCLDWDDKAMAFTVTLRRGTKVKVYDKHKLEDKRYAWQDSRGWLAYVDDMPYYQDE